MSLPRPKTELPSPDPTAKGDGLVENDRDGSRDVELASDDAVEKAIKRVTRENRDLIVALSK